MKKKISRLICAVACCVPVALQAQTSEKITSPVNLYKEGKELFLQKNYAAAMPPLRTFVRRFFTQQFKRSAMPDGPKVGTVTLSPRGDWRMPSDASGSLWLAEAEAL